MRPENERGRLAGGEAAIKQLDQERSPSVVDRRSAERARRSRRWARRELDEILGIAVPSSGGQIDYAACGLTLGWPERRAAGIALLHKENVA